MSSFTQIMQMARSSILANLSNLDVVSNNLANIYTTGYKSTRLNFQELYLRIAKMVYKKFRHNPILHRELLTILETRWI